MSTELAEYTESQQALSLVSMRSPTEVLAEAKKAAVALREVLEAKPKKVMMNGEQYLEVEDWQTVGRFYSITSIADGDPEFVDLAGIRGFKASALAVDGTGRTIGRATAYCLNDEEKWSTRPKYEWAYVKKSGGHSVEDPGRDELIWVPNPRDESKNVPKKERIYTGEETVPLFQLASMAQTRAAAKSLRNVLSWVVVLAGPGIRTTPAEELDGKTTVEENDARPTKQAAAKAPNGGAAKTPAPPPAAKPAPASNGSSTPKHGQRWTAPCPRCGKTGTVYVSKKADEPGWYCWKKAAANGGGCGYAFTEDDVAIHAGAEQARAAQATVPAGPPSKPTAAPDDPWGDSLDGPDAPGAEKE